MTVGGGGFRNGASLKGGGAEGIHVLPADGCIFDSAVERQRPVDPGWSSTADASPHFLKLWQLRDNWGNVEILNKGVGKSCNK